jgi:hypothetical protein
MKTKFVSGRNNLAVTIMVPFDCPNNCPFCESKKEYAKNRPSLDGVVNAVKHIFRDNNTLDIPEVVITGGEPMANILALRKIINANPSDKDIYINTTCVRHNFDECVALVNSDPQIKGVNISRHSTTYEEDCKTLHGIVPDEWLSKFEKSVRINCVIKDITHSFFHDVISRWEGKDVELSFREDFNTMTEEELHNPYTVPFGLLGNVKNYVGNTHCKVCDTTTFLTRKDMVIRYHKGIKNTLVYLGNDKYEINDIIVRQDGQVFCDWNFTNNTLLPTILLHQRTVEETRAIHHKIVEETKRSVGGCGGYYVDLYRGGCGGGVPLSSCGVGACGGAITYYSGCGGSVSSGGC